jgi:purine catabolism regulator
VVKETGVILKDILSMKLLKDCKVIAGSGNLDNTVKSINVMSDPDIINCVNEGELLLATGYYFKNSSLEDQIKLIKDCSAKKLAGIGIKTKPYIDKLPIEISRTAEKLNFPVIEISSEISFADIMTPVFQKIFDRQSSVINKVETLHNDTMNVVLKGGGIQDILRSLAKSVENPVVIKDHHFEELIFHDNSNYELNTKIENDIKATVSSSDFLNKQGKTISDTTIMGEKEIDRLMVPIVVKGNVYGHIITYGIERDLSNFDALYLESTSNVIALEFLKRMSVQDVENKYKAEFLDDLISVDEKRNAKALDRAIHYKFDKDMYYSIMSIRMSKSESNLINHEEYNQAITKAMYLIDLVCQDVGRTFLIAQKRKKVHILFMWKNVDEHKKISQSVAQGVKEILDGKMSYISYKIGIGRVYENIESVGKSLTDAEQAVNAAKSYINESVVDFDTLGIYKIFCQDNLKDELMDFYENTLEPLVLYDRKRDTELVKSLAIYFETNGNLKRMSEMLFTHYNTVLYRINRIQEITKKSLDNENDRYGLQTALKIMRIFDLQ